MDLFILTLLFLLFVWVFFDANHYLLTLINGVYGLIKSVFTSLKLMDESVFYGICMTSDLDFQFHMNNAKYLKNCDYARITHFGLTRIYQSTKKIGSNIVMGATNIRYRRSLKLLDIYRIHTKILCWDERAFYIEQRFERQKDNFICAIAVIKMTMTKGIPQQIVDMLQPGLTSPEPSPEVGHWIQSITLSSERLRKTD